MPQVTDMMGSSNFWRGTDFQHGEEQRLTVKDITQELLGAEQEKKWVMSFVEDARRLTLGKRNLERGARLYGNDTDDWLGQPVILCGEGTQTPSGQPTIGVRISLKRPEAASQPVSSAPIPAPAPPPPPPPPARGPNG